MIMKISGLILVIFYALLMLFALWKQHSKTASPMADASPADGSSSMGGMCSSLCIGAGCLLLLAYSLIYIVQNHSLMPLLVTGMLGISAGTLLNGIRLKKVHIQHHIIRLILEAVMIAVCWMSVKSW